MKFAKNRLYIELYTKCPNCGILIYEDAKQNVLETKLVGGQTYCSAWCVEWEADRAARQHAHAAPNSAT